MKEGSILDSHDNFYHPHQEIGNVRSAGPVLRGAALAGLPCIPDAFLLIKSGRIADYGKMEDLRFSAADFNLHISASERRMIPEEAINAATLNGAFAMELADEVGSISVGKRANLIITKPVPSFHYLPYAFGSNLIENVLICGEPLNV